jgi:hypothetical protein
MFLLFVLLNMSVLIKVLHTQNIRRQNLLVKKTHAVNYLRWDKADLSQYYDYTREGLLPMLDFVKEYDLGIRYENPAEINSIVEQVFFDVSGVLSDGALSSVPVRARNAFKCWWDEEMRSIIKLNRWLLIGIGYGLANQGKGRLLRRGLLLDFVIVKN